MKSYVVGGAVRDRLLGLPVSDRDHVVVGATVDEMLAAGFRPVGRDFPVFLHPTTHEEYALARTERKTAPGYAGFVFHADAGVTLDEDLARRDLTVNAMAEDEAAGTIVDPFGGRADLDARVLRHVGPAFVEDPVRILRLARFAARFHAFRVADETMALARRMADAGEVDALVPERVWQELSRGLMEARPSRMLAVLDEAGALARLVPELYAGKARVADVAARLDRAADAGATLVVRFAILAQALPDAAALAAVAARFAVPAALRDVAAHAIREHDAILEFDAGSTAIEADAAERAVALLERTDAFRRPERFAELVESVRAASSEAPAGARIGQAVRAARAVDAAAIARAHPGQGARMPALLHAARVAAVASAFGTPDVAA